MPIKNPGTFTPRRIKGPLEIARITARRALEGKVVDAGRLGAAEAANWGISHLGSWLPSKVRCPCCGYRGASFLSVHNRARTAWNSACPQCDSRSRHRGLSVLIPQLLARRAPRPRILHFAPEEVLRRVVEPLAGVYHTSDFAMEGVTYPHEDLTRSQLPAAAYDVVLCNHVLEHIEDDAAAVASLARVLIPDGLAIVTIPGVFSRRETVHYPDDSLGGHWRDYGLEVVDLFARVFVDVETVDLHAFDRADGALSQGIRPGEVAFVMRGPRYLAG
jgi:SAM-dependent methyltransferase